jgi:glycosyltransferase involved in cell wall biosynthesis
LLKVIPILRSLKVLQIVENLDNGAVETWLLNVFREAQRDSNQLDWTFYCILGNIGVNEKEVIQLGGKVIHSKFGFSGKFSFLKELRSVLKEGNFDVMVSQHDYLSGLYYLASIGLNIKKRITYIHNLEKGIPASGKLKRALFAIVFKQLTIWFSDKIVAVSNIALNTFSSNLGAKGQVIYCGIDLNKYKESYPIEETRAELQISLEAKILLFVGRLDKDKNSIFIVNVLKELIKSNRQQDYYAVFVGVGNYKEPIKKLAEELGVSTNIRILGHRKDVVRFYDAADIFVFPRFEEIPEGLGLAIVEAQATGLPIVTTKAIPNDAFVINGLINILSSKDSPSIWARSIETILQKVKREKEDSFRMIIESPFSMKNSTINTLKLLHE